MARTPEEALETAYQDGVEAAKHHGFQLTYELIKSHSGVYYTRREDSLGRPYQRLVLSEADLGLDSDEFKWAKLKGEDGLQVFTDRSYVRVNKCAVLTSDQGMAAFVLGIANVDRNTLHDPVLKMGVSPLTPGKERLRYKIGVISMLLDGGINPNSAFRAQIAYDNDAFHPRFMVEGEASYAIPGLHRLDNNWLLEDKGRDALRGLVDDPFYQLERYQCLTPLGLQI